MIFKRTELLLGKENLEKLRNSHIIIFGVGGVGGYVLEGLVRAGIGSLTIVDFDKIDITNLNRQIITTQENIGESKVKVAKKRAISINPEIKIYEYEEKFFKEKNDIFFRDKKYDYIVDAIDIVTSKLDLIEIAKKLNIPIISSMGTGNKLNPMMFEIADISKTSVCPLAKIIRQEVKKRRLGKVKVIYSKEQPKKPKSDGREKEKNIGSISFVPSVVGLIIASEVVRDICNNDEVKK